MLIQHVIFFPYCLVNRAVPAILLLQRHLNFLKIKHSRLTEFLQVLGCLFVFWDPHKMLVTKTFLEMDAAHPGKPILFLPCCPKMLVTFMQCLETTALCYLHLSKSLPKRLVWMVPSPSATLLPVSQ